MAARERDLRLSRRNAGDLSHQDSQAGGGTAGDQSEVDSGICTPCASPDWGLEIGDFGFRRRTTVGSDHFDLFPLAP